MARTGPSYPSGVASSTSLGRPILGGDGRGGDVRGASPVGGVRGGGVRAAGPVRSAGQGTDVSAGAAAGRTAQVDAADGRAPRGGSAGAAAVRLLLHLGGGGGARTAGRPRHRDDSSGCLGGRR